MKYYFPQTRNNSEQLRNTDSFPHKKHTTTNFGEGAERNAIVRNQFYNLVRKSHMWQPGR